MIAKSNLLPIALLLMAAAASADELAKPVMPTNVVTAIINTSIKFYWGKAVDKDGNVIEAPDRRQAMQPPIDRNDAVRIVDSVGISGLAEFCKMDWKPFHDSFMTHEQTTHHWSDDQMLYVENLYEGTHAVALNAAQKSVRCTDDIADRVSTRLSDAESQIEAQPALNATADHGAAPNGLVTDDTVPPANPDGPNSYTITGSGNRAPAAADDDSAAPQ